MNLIIRVAVVIDVSSCFKIMFSVQLSQVIICPELRNQIKPFECTPGHTYKSA